MGKLRVDSSVGNQPTTTSKKIALWGLVALLSGFSLQAEENWYGAEWIACTRPMGEPRMVPPELIGSWITAPSDALVQSYRTEINLPDIPVVRAIACTGSLHGPRCTAIANGDQTALHQRMHSPRGYIDLAFDLVPGINTIDVLFDTPQEDMPVCFGMRVQLADGSVRQVLSSASWEAVLADGRQIPVSVLGDYGAENFREIVAFQRERLAPVWLRKSFEVKPGLKSANLHHTGVGYADAWVNGAVVSDRVLSPPQTDYEYVTMFESDDVTNMVRTGLNVLSVQLAPGFYDQVGGFGVIFSYGRPRMKASLILEYEDGTVETVVSDSTWQWKEGAWQEANVYNGEIVDFRQAHDEWAVPGKGAGWQLAKTVEPPGENLLPRDFEPMRRVRKIAPRSVERIGEQTWLLDFGENIAGWIRLPIAEKAGKEIIIRYSEMARNGQIENVPRSHWWTHGEPQRDLVIAGLKPTTYESRFAYKGFRWVEVSGLTEPPDPATVRAVVVNTDVPTTAHFSSSSELLNRLWDMGLRTHYANMHSILEDCPHREKCLWGGDLHASWSLGFHAMDGLAFYRQQVRLFYTPPMAEGNIPGLVGVGKRLSTTQLSFNWGVSPLFITWRLWTQYGDMETAREAFEPMRHYLAWFRERSPDGFPHLHEYADHAATVGVTRYPEDKELISAINFFAAAERFGQLADALGSAEDAQWAAELAAEIRQAVLTRYDHENHTFRNGTHDSLALAMGIFRDDEAEQAALAESLVGYYRANGYKFDGGFMSYWIYPMLSRYGYADDAYQMLINTDYPGPASSIKKYDATTFWERYFPDEDAQFSRSFSHHAVNHPAAWLLTDLAGIRVDMEKPGGRHLLLGPSFPRDLEWVEGSMQTVAGGEISSAWKQVDDHVDWSVTIPEGIEARVELLGWTRADGEPLPRQLEPGSYRFLLQR